MNIDWVKRKPKTHQFSEINIGAMFTTVEDNGEMTGELFEKIEEYTMLGRKSNAFRLTRKGRIENRFVFFHTNTKIIVAYQKTPAVFSCIMVEENSKGEEDAI